MAKRKGGGPEAKPLSRAKLERFVLTQTTQDDLADVEALRARIREEPLAPAAAKLLDDDTALAALVERARETAPSAEEAAADGAGERPHDIGWILQDALDYLTPLADKAERAGYSQKDADEVRWRLDELAVAYSALRWATLTGAPPTREDWGGTEPAELGWPTVDLVEELFESFEKLHAVTGLTDSKVGEGFALAQEAATAAREAEQRARAVIAEAEKEALRRRELQRQLDQAKQKADAARGEALAAQGRAERAEERLAAAERKLAERPRPVAPAPAAQATASLEELRTENATLHAHVEQLADRVAALERELDDEHRRAAYAPPTLAETPIEVHDDGGPGSHYTAIRDRLEALPDPDSVRDAVDVAAGGLTPHLVYAARAFESADDSPFRSPRTLLGDLVKLDRIAEMYLRGDIGTSLYDVSRELNLDWVEDSNSADHGVRGRFYRYEHAGREWVLRPHVRVGGRAPGANATARIYVTLHEGDDEVPRSVIVGHVGRKLPDTTT